MAFRWPRNHHARHVRGWHVPVPVEDPFQLWIDDDGHWWMLRFDAGGTPLDVHTIGTPLKRAAELDSIAGALERILVEMGVER